MIIGLTGSIASGKGLVADFLKKRGFVYLSLSDELREIARNRGIEITRENLQNLGNSLREQSGGGVLAEAVLNKILSQQYKNVVVDGIRNPLEVEVMKRFKDFYLVAIDSNSEIRFRRIISRARESDPKSWEEFLRVDARDKGVGELATGQNVARCIEMSDFMLMNNGTLEETDLRVKEIYNKILLRLPRPSWDEYFIKMAALVAERSTCLRHHVGAVIVKDKRVLTTGYNGAAKGVDDCIKLGCLRDALKIPSGTRHEICRAIHSEQNAIIQAGLHGITISGATLYCTHTPCMICSKMIVNAGIKEVVSYQDYADADARKFLMDAGVFLRRIDRPGINIEFRD